MDKDRLTELVELIILNSHRLRAVGRELGAVTARGGAWGLLRSLDLHGPQTIPQLARSRPVSRQHVRQLSQSLEKRGWIEMVPNPGHKRSFLLRLTPSGRAALGAMNRQIGSFMEDWLDGLPEPGIEHSIATLKTLSERLERFLAR